MEIIDIKIVGFFLLVREDYKLGSGESLEEKPRRGNPTLAAIARARYKLLKGRLSTKKILQIHKYLEKEVFQTIQIHNEYLLKILRRFDGQSKA